MKVYKGLPTMKKNVRTSFVANSTGTVGENESVNMFTPQYWAAYWSNKDCVPHCTVAISIPSGLSNAYEENLREAIVATVGYNGTSLIVKCVWPDLLQDTDFLKNGFRGLIDKESLTSMILTVKQEILTMKKESNINTDCKMGSVCMIPLKGQFEVRPVLVHILQDPHGSTVMYVVLRAHTRENYEESTMMTVQQVTKKY
jgi:hypothetical protein